MSDDARQDLLTVEGLKAYYQMNYFGVRREVRAVDDITMTVRRNEVYGIAGESSSGKTSFIKVLAAAMRPPLRIVEGSVKYDFRSGPIDVATASPQEIEAVRWKQPFLHHAGLDERAQSGAPHRQDLPRLCRPARWDLRARHSRRVSSTIWGG